MKWTVPLWWYQTLFYRIVVRIGNILLNILHRFYCLLIGIAYIDNKVRNRRDRLLLNDQYRDRLTEKEVNALVDIQEALKLSHDQRHAYFLHFIKLDWTRRASVSPRQLLLFCSIRRTRFTETLLSVNRSKSFRKNTGRMDIIQMMAMLFSICTLSPSQMIDEMLEIVQNDVVIQKLEAAHEKNKFASSTYRAEFVCSSATTSFTSTALMQRIFQLLHFMYGTLTSHESSLLALLQEFYTPVVDSTSSTSSLNFMEIHRVRTIRDVLYRFPVLIYPAFGIRQTLRRRIVGEPFWNQVEKRRDELYHHGIDHVFVSHDELLHAADMERQRKLQLSALRKKEGTKEQKSFWMRTSKNLSKVLPQSVRNLFHRGGLYKIKTRVKSVYERGDLYHFSQYCNMEEAWQVTANSLLASIHLQNQRQGKSSNEDTSTLALEFDRISNAMKSGTMSDSECTLIHKSIVKAYGYQFSRFVFTRSHLAYFVYDKVEKSTLDRCQQALHQGHAIPPNTTHVKEYFDPKCQKQFYYDFRTGESSWEKPLSPLTTP